MGTVYKQHIWVIIVQEMVRFRDILMENITRSYTANLAEMRLIYHSIGAYKGDMILRIMGALIIVTFIQFRTTKIYTTL